MLLKAIRRHAHEFSYEIQTVIGQRYPSFVYERSPVPRLDEVPVFVHHSIEPESFESQLEYLSRHGYRTLSIEEFYSFLRGDLRLTDPSVLLTIDDGRSSVWTYGYPLLKKYGMRATVFLIPGYISEGPRSLNLEDYWAGRCDFAALRSRDPDLMTWSEIREAHTSGLLDFQSHTLYHHRVFTGPEVVDFVHPGSTRAVFDLVVSQASEAVVRERGMEALWGAPVYEHDSLMSGRPRYLNDERLTQACTDFVMAEGGASFFERKGWRGELLRLMQARRAERGPTERFQTREELAEEIGSQLRQARQRIERELPGSSVRHLCYPYTIGSALSVEMSRAAGYVSNFWGVNVPRRANAPGDDPFYCPRLKEDFIFRLPGAGRKSISEIFAGKVRRRLGGGPVY